MITTTSLRRLVLFLNTLCLLGAAWCGLQWWQKHTLEIPAEPEHIITVVRKISPHRCLTCSPGRPLGCHDNGAGDAPDENYKNYRPATTKHFDDESIRCFETKRLRFREATLRDLPHIHDLLSNKAVMARTQFPVHTNKSQTRALLTRWREKYKKAYIAPCAIELKKTNTVIGIGGWSGYFPDGQRCYMAYTLDPRYDGEGYQTEFIRGLIDFGFNEMDFRRVEILVRAGDRVGFEAACEAGMSHEGRQLDYKKIDGQFVSFDMFGILRRQVGKHS